MDRYLHIHSLKRKAIAQMPDYLGQAFEWWHDRFNGINDMLDSAWVFGNREEYDNVKSSLDLAKNGKDDIEKALREQPAAATPRPDRRCA